MIRDAYDDMTAAEFTAAAPPRGTPSRAALVLAAEREDLHDYRDCDPAFLQPRAGEWCEE